MWGGVEQTGSAVESFNKQPNSKYFTKLLFLASISRHVRNEWVLLKLMKRQLKSIIINMIVIVLLSGILVGR